jgi:hypothetical protein
MVSPIRIWAPVIVALGFGAAGQPAESGIRQGGVLPERHVPPVTPSSTRLHIARDGTIPARVGCPPRQDVSECFGDARLTTDRDIGAADITRVAHFSATPGRRIIVRLQLNAAGRARLGHNEIPVRLVLTNFGEGPGQTYKSLLLSLK